MRDFQKNMDAKTFANFNCGHCSQSPDGHYMMEYAKQHKGLLEGVNVRQIGVKLKAEIKERGLTAEVNNLGPVDTGLKSRVQYSNYAYRRMGNVLHVPLHHNAVTVKKGDEWANASGARFLYHPWSKTSKRIAEVFAEQFKKHTLLGGKIVPSRWLYELRRTVGPAVLAEMGFMTNMEDNYYLQSEQGQGDIVNALCETVEALQHD